MSRHGFSDLLPFSVTLVELVALVRVMAAFHDSELGLRLSEYILILGISFA